MGANSRFIGLVMFFAAAAAILWLVTRGPAESPTPVETAATPAAALPPESREPPELAPARPQLPTREATSRSARRPASRDEPKPKKDYAGTGVIHVSVVGLDKRPASGAIVGLERVDWEPNEDPPGDVLQREGITAADGKVTFTELPDGSYVARGYTSNGMQSATAGLTERTREDTAILELWPAAPVAGLVVTAAGEPVPDALIYVYESDRFRELGPLTTARATSSRQRTDELGRFTFPALWTGEWRLYAKADGYASAITEWFRVPSGNVQIVLGVGGTVSGHVVHGDTQEPVPGIEVAVLSDFIRDQLKSTAAEDGTFTISGVRAGDIRLTVDDVELVLAEAVPVAVRDGEVTSDHELRVVPGGIITGRVYDEDTGVGISGAELRASAQGEAAPSREDIITGRDGVYEIRGLGKSVYEVTPREAEGYSPTMYELRKQVSVVPGQTFDGIDFMLDRGLVVSGRVIDAHGRGIPGVRLTGNAMNGRGYGTDDTDASGGFLVAGLEPGQVNLDAQKDGFGRVTKSEQLGAEGLSGLEIVLVSEATIEGIVVDKQGRPVANVPITARSNYQTMWTSSDAVNSAADGTFRITRLSEGQHQIHIARVGQEPWNGKSVESVTLNPGQPLDGVRLLYDFGEGRRIAGRATNKQGQPIPGVTIQGWSNMGGEQIRASTDADGRYAVEGLSEGQYQLNASHSSFSTANFQATAGTDNNDFVMDGRGAISGRVVHARTSQPMREFEIMHVLGQQDYGYMSSSFRLVVDEAGEFLIENVEAGPNTVYARANGFARSFTVVPSVRAGETVSNVELRLDPAAALEGLVTDRQGNPIANAMIFEGPAPQEWVRDQATLTRTDANGAFRVETLSPHTTEVSASHPEFVAASAPVVLDSSKVAYAEIVLGSGGVIEGTVREAGKPYAGATIYAQLGNGSMSKNGNTGADGQYQMSGVPVGEIIVSANVMSGTPGGNRNANKRATVDEGMATIVDFDFGAGNATVEGYVTRAGEPVAQSHVQAFAGAMFDGGEQMSAQTDAAGYYRIEGLAAGPLSVMFMAQGGPGGYSQKRLSAEAIDGQVTRIDIDFDTGQTVTATVTNLTSGFDTSALLLNPDVDLDIPLTMERVMELFQCCMVANAQVGPNGAVALDGIEPGEYQLFVMSADDRNGASPEDIFATALTAHAPITVTEGENAHIELTLR